MSDSKPNPKTTNPDQKTSKRPDIESSNAQIGVGKIVSRPGKDSEVAPKTSSPPVVEFKNVTKTSAAAPPADSALIEPTPARSRPAVTTAARTTSGSAPASALARTGPAPGRALDASERRPPRASADGAHARRPRRSRPQADRRLVRSPSRRGARRVRASRTRPPRGRRPSARRLGIKRSPVARRRTRGAPRRTSSPEPRARASVRGPALAGSAAGGAA